MPQCLALARHAYVPIQFRHGLSLKSFRSHSTCAIPKRRFDRILIANRGEIALRVMKTARRMAIECIAVYSDADRDAQHVKFADCAYRLGEAPALNSYLCIDKILDVASRSGAQAIHPGYGFLSENAGFAEACQRAGVKFIGPSAQAIRDMGMKNRAKEIMIAAGVPTLDGYNGREQGDAELLEQAKQIGFPVMIKPVCGGGGKGMRISHSVDDFLPLLHSAQSESTKSFNNADMIIERFVERPRHVEVQVFGDQHGNYVHLWERDCSVQRRHQKIIEEAPAPGLSQEVRDSLGKSAVDAARAVEYEGAGTVEFLMDTSDGRFYFMEMNTRLQVEHPVTESITHIDLVEWQLRVARGEQLPKEQRNIYLFGHALEARLYAEAINPDTMDFMPSAGRLEYLSFPTSDKARVDSGVVEGDEVSVHYDPMIAKVIVWGPSRQEAISRLDKALAETEIGGLPNNVEYVRACLNHPEYMDHATLSTKFIENNRRELYEKTVHPEFSMEQLFEGAVAEILLKTFFSHPHSVPFQRGNFFRLNTTHRRLVELNDRTWMEVEVLQGSSPFHYRIRQLPKAKSYQEQSSEERLEGGERVEVRAKDIVNSLSDVSECQVVEFTLEVMGGGKSWRAKAVQLSDSILVYGSSLPPRRWDVPASERDSHGGQDEDSAAGGSTTEARAPIPGMVEKVLVGVGDTVTRGQPLAILNAMKMEFVIKAPCDCVVESVECQVGQQVSKKALLVKFKPVGGEGE